ncbi:restriction endonuclease [Poriferisphaera corsica]|uniref:restriction endonuclease n=1 Tax=Poriferisphaera corsica TaxID=2528020 RepID=UPI00190A13FA|nr:restriction endonuclease [Poriferisphaera corsica]
MTWSGFKQNLSKLKDRKELHEYLEKFYPDFTKAHRSQNSGQIWAFTKRMKAGDWVCMPSKRKTIHIGEITGNYVYSDDAENPYYHHRTINWIETDVPRTNFDQDLLYSLGSISTICQIKRNDSEERIRAMQANGWKSVGVSIKTPVTNGDDDQDIVNGNEQEIDIEEIANDHIARTIQAKFKGHGLEALVEAILKAKGFTTHRSDKGADGGIDILAAPDTLGFGQPRICVQVKSQDSPLERPVLDQLVGTMQHVGADQGLLVCWGGFKKTIKHELPRLFFKVRMWDRSDLIDEFLKVYNDLDEDIKADIPLKRVWAVANQDNDDED